MEKTGNVSNRVISFVVALAMCFSLVSCNVDKTDSNGLDEAQSDTVTVTDMMGREVSIPADTKNNTVASAYGVMTPIFMSLDMLERIDGAAFKNKGFLRLADERIDSVETVGNNAVDMEALATANPDVFVCKVYENEKIEAVTKLGIPVITINAETPEDVIKTYELMGKVFGVEKEAQVVIDYINSQLAEIKDLTSGIDESQKKTAIVLGSEISRVAGDDMLQTILLEMAGAKPLVSGINNNMIWVNIGTEKLMELNPDYIFATSSSVLNYSVDDFYNDSAWSALTAVKNKNIYKIPAKKDSWDMPGPGFVLAAYFMINTMYPEILSDDELQTKIDEFYMMMYDKTFDGETIGY